MDKDSYAPYAMRAWHETPAILEGAIHLSANVKTSYLKSPHDNNMGADAHDALATLRMFGEGGVLRTTTNNEHTVRVAYLRICASLVTLASCVT